MTTKNEEINLRLLIKSALEIIKSSSKTFLLLFIFIFIFFGVLYTYISIKPTYKTSLMLKSRYVGINQLNSIVEKFNSDIELSDDKSEKSVFLIENNISSFKISEIKLSEASQKEDKNSYYDLNIFFNTNPDINEDTFINSIIINLKEYIEEDKEILSNKNIFEQYLIELDELSSINFEAIQDFKSVINDSPENLIVVSDIFHNLRETLKMKRDVETDLFGYQNENLIYSIAPITIQKQYTKPYILFFIAFIIWLIVCFFWVFTLVLLKDDF